MPVTKQGAESRAKIKLANNLVIKNFKSIKYAELTTSRVNIFIGRPNSGKSNTLEALTLFNSIQNKSEKRAGPTLIRYNTLDNLFYDRNLSEDVQVIYDQNLALLTYYPGADTFLQLVNPSSDFLKSKNSYFKAGLSLNEIQAKILPQNYKEGSTHYEYLYRQLNQDGSVTGPGVGLLNEENPIRKYEFRDEFSYSDPFRRYLKSSGSNLFTIVQENPSIREWITSFFEEFNLEFLLDFSSRKFEIQKKEKGIVYKIPFELTPDTLRRMLFYIAAIYSNKGATILLEEPEAHSFPPYINELSERIKADMNNKYFITTHSPYFFNSLVEDSKKIKDMAFFHVYYEDFQTKIKRLSQKDLNIIWGSSADVFFNLDSVVK